MSIEVVTSLPTLMRYAYELGQARLSGDLERIAEAKLVHDDYAQACIRADRMVMGCTVGDLRG